MKRIFILFFALNLFAQESKDDIFSFIDEIDTSKMPEDTEETDSEGYNTIRGKVSWYGEELNGKNTASGEVFDLSKYTAATHVEFDFNTKLKITNPLNNKSVVVKVNDRMPVSNTRKVDLSKQAAIILDIIGVGVIDAIIEIVNEDIPLGEFDAEMGLNTTVKDDNTELSLIQIASFSSEKNANSLVSTLKDKDLEASIEIVQDKNLFRVVIINVKKEDIELLKNKLQDLGYSGLLVRKQTGLLKK